MSPDFRRRPKKRAHLAPPSPPSTLLCRKSHRLVHDRVTHGPGASGRILVVSGAGLVEAEAAMLRSRRANRVEAGVQVTRRRRRVSRARLRRLRRGRPPTAHRRGRRHGCRPRRRGRDLRRDTGVGDNRLATTRSAPSTPTGSRSPMTRSSSRWVTSWSPSSASSWARRSARTGEFLAATSTDKSRGPADLRPEELQAHLDGRHRAGVSQSLSDGTVGQEGPTYSPDGKFLWLPQQNALTRFPVNADGTLGTPTRFPLPTVGSHPAR